MQFYLQLLVIRLVLWQVFTDWQSSNIRTIYISLLYSRHGTFIHKTFTRSMGSRVDGELKSKMLADKRTQYDYSHINLYYIMYNSKSRHNIRNSFLIIYLFFFFFWNIWKTSLNVIRNYFESARTSVTFLSRVATVLTESRETRTTNTRQTHQRFGWGRAQGKKQQ